MTTASRETVLARWPWLRGMTLATPIVMGYIPIGF